MKNSKLTISTNKNYKFFNLSAWCLWIDNTFSEDLALRIKANLSPLCLENHPDIANKNESEMDRVLIFLWQFANWYDTNEGASYWECVRETALKCTTFEQFKSI